MRPPRYQFSDETRSVTRDIAARMVRDGAVAETPEQLDAWIANDPETRATLERDGYGHEFSAHDLFPLLQAIVNRVGGPGAAVQKAPGSSRTWMLVVFLVLVFALLVYALVTNASAASLS